ncbi:MAG: hypothetical protein NZ927_09755, partial [Candidatus Calescibacterium sp.]|nr:hypothetical protein [Candidatus Calescibacterium sp.]
EVYFRYGILYLKLPSFIRYLLHFCSLNDKRYSFKKQYNLPRVYFEYRHARITYDNGKIEVYGLGISKKLVKWMFKELEKFYQDFLNIYKKEVSGWGG